MTNVTKGGRSRQQTSPKVDAADNKRHQRWTQQTTNVTKGGRSRRQTPPSTCLATVARPTCCSLPAIECHWLGASNETAEEEARRNGCRVTTARTPHRERRVLQRRDGQSRTRSRHVGECHRVGHPLGWTCKPSWCYVTRVRENSKRSDLLSWPRMATDTEQRLCPSNVSDAGHR
jgi:hypothetical protein